MLEVHILSLFPEAIKSYLDASILGRAQNSDLLQVNVLDFRQFAKGTRRNVDDRPYGGGPGMVLKPEPIFSAIEWVEENFGPARKILLSPDGVPFKQQHATEFVKEERLLLLCGRYEGYDERIRLGIDFTEVSIGDYVLCGGELGALAVIEATTRLIPGALGHSESAVQESFTRPDLLDHPHYTRPEEFRGMRVPEILLSGDHQKVDDWRQQQAAERTKLRRPDLLNHNNKKET